MADCTLLEEFLLLTLEDEGGEFDQVPEIYLACGVVGAVLMDLALRERLDSDLQGIWAVDTTPTGDPILDGVLAEIAAEPVRLDSRTWIKRLSRRAFQMRTTAIDHLCEQGILRQSDSQFLWVMKERRYPVVDGQQRPEAKGRVLALLFNSDIPQPYDIALTSLADACSVFERILKPKELSRAQGRIKLIAGMDLIGGEIARTAERLNAEIRAGERNTIIGGLAGNVMEWYDFGVYGFFAVVIGQQFFPSHDAALSLLASFGVFAVGFLGRPLGAAILGHLGDSKGRHSALMLSILLMVAPTTIMGMLPTYAQIGVAAPILLILMRLLQGMAVGGEFTTSIVVLVEAAQPSRRGYVGSFAGLGSQGGALLGSGVGAFLFWLLTPEAAASWGWRLAFFVGVALGAVVLLVRRKMPRDEVIVAVEKARSSPLVQAFRTQWRSILKIIAIVAPGFVGNTLCMVYLPIWLQQTQGMSTSTSLLINCVAIAFTMLITPIMGRFSDAFGRKPTLLLGMAGLMLLSFPLFWVMLHASVLWILLGRCGFALIGTLLWVGLSSFMVEALPKHVRCSGLSIGYNVSSALFAGTVPLVADWLVQQTGLALAPSIYATLAAAIALCVLVVTLSGHRRYAME